MHPLSPKFKENLDDFASICRVVKGMKRFTIGCLGARTTAFKTVRFDEVTLEKYGITVDNTIGADESLKMIKSFFEERRKK